MSTETTETELHPSYLDLCSRVEKLDPEAAKYMREGAQELESFAGTQERWGAGGSVGDSVDQIFEWDAAPQGFRYWNNIHTRIESNEDKTK